MGCSTSTSSATETLKQKDILTVDDGGVTESISLHDSPRLEDLNMQNKVHLGYSPAASEAFVIPFDDDDQGNESETSVKGAANVRKQPPKRIQELIEQATTGQSLRLEDLEEKLNKAEIRRKYFLQQKIESIQKTTQLNSSSDSNVKSN